jgi:hypothetical protein
VASPDISKYIDLTVYDLQPEEIYDAATAYARTALPEWSPVSGSIEDALLQAASLMTGELVGAINRLPAGVTEGLLKLYGIERNIGTAPSAVVEVELVDDVGHTIPVGTRFGYLDSTELEPILYVFETTEQSTVAPGNTTAIIPIRGILLENYPFLLAGQSLQLLSSISFIDSVTLTVNSDPGQDPETETQFLDRAKAAFGQFSEALVLPSQFSRHALLNYANIYRANAYSRLQTERSIDAWELDGGTSTLTLDLGAAHDVTAAEQIRILLGEEAIDGVYLVSSTSGASLTVECDGETNSGNSGVVISHRLQNPTPENGYLTIYVAGVDGASVNGATLATLEEDLTDRSVAGLQIYASNAAEASLTVTVDIVKERSTTISSVSQSVENAVAEYLHPDYWGWDDVIYKNELISLIDSVPGVVRVIDVEIEAADATLVDVDPVTGDGTFLLKGLLPRQTTLVNVNTG